MRLPGTDREAVDRLKLYFSKIQIADKDADLDRDGYTSTNWDGDSFSNGATGTIDWVVNFGLPEIPKFVFLIVYVRDSASAGGSYFLSLKARVTTTQDSARCYAERAINDDWRAHNVAVPVADNGTTHYTVVASGVNTMDIYIRINAWVK